MYAQPVKRLQIMIDEDLDEALGRKAREDGISKAAIIRSVLRERLEPPPMLEADALWHFFDLAEGAPDDSALVDDVVYGSR